MSIILSFFPCPHDTVALFTALCATAVGALAVSH